jgi:hypothetical protein
VGVKNSWSGVKTDGYDSDDADTGVMDGPMVIGSSITMPGSSLGA